MITYTFLSVLFLISIILSISSSNGYMDNDLIHNVDKAKMFMIGRMVGDENSYTYYEPEAIIAYTDAQAIRTYSEIHDAYDAALIFQLKDNCKKLEVMN